MKRIIAATLTVTALLLTAKSQAGTDTWNQLSGGDASGSWNTAVTPPWSTGALPGATDTADFSTLDITADSTVTLDGNQSINALIFGDTTTSSAAGWILSPGAPATSTLTLSGASPTVTVNTLGGSKVATISNLLAGTAGLTKAGAGILTLSATNTYSGGTTVSGGTLKAGTTNCFGPNNSAITIASGATLDVNAISLNGYNGTSNYVVSVAGTGVGGKGAIYNSGGTQTHALRNITLTGDTTFGGSGAWGLSGESAGNATLTGGGYNLTAAGSAAFYVQGTGSVLTNIQNININSSYIAMIQSFTLDNNTPGSIYINSGGTLRLGLYGQSASNMKLLKPIVMVGGVLGTDNTGANGNAVVSGGITLNATGIFAPQSTSTLTLNGPIVNGSANSIIFNAAISGAGTNVLTATNTFTGPIITNIGTVMISGAGQLGSGAYAGNITNGGSFIYNSSAAQTLSGVIAGAGSFTDSGTGTLIFSGANTYAGGTTISAGILEADNNSALGSGLLTLGGGTLSNNVGGTFSIPVNLSANSTVGVATSQTLTLSGAITNTGGLSKSGAGTLSLTAANSYTGATTVNGGTLALSGSGALATNTAITINGGTLDLGSQNATNNLGNTTGITFGANGGNLNGTGTNYMLGNAGSYTAFTVPANASAVINENLNITNTANSGYFNLVNAGSGGMLTINGVLTALNNPSGLFLAGGGALTLNNAANNFNTIIYNSGTLITTNFATLGSYPYLAQMGQGVANGPCTFNYGGPAASTTRSVIGNASIININNNGGGLVSFTASPFNLRYGGAQTGAGQQLVFGGTSDMAIAGVMQDNTPGTYSTAVVKTNANTLTLYGNSTYSGATTIKGGSLIGVTAGSCSNSAVTLAAITGSSAILGVTVTNTTKQWTISSLTVNNGGVSSSLQFNFGALTPGTTAAALNVTGALTFTTTPAIIITGSSLPASTGNGYPLMTWGSGGPATTNGMTLSLPFRAGGTLAIVGNTLYLQSSGSTEPLSWTGGNGTWDVNNIANNTIWKDNASASTYYVDGDSVVFNNTVGSGGTVTLNSSISPASVTVTNPTANYTISGSGGIAGSTALTKSGAGTLTITTTNSFTGTTTVNGGTLALTNNGTLSTAAAITINGGTLDMGSQNATNNQGNNNGISFGVNGGYLNGTGTNTIVGTSGAAIALQVAANGNAVVNENIAVTNLANSGYEALASVVSGASLTVNGSVKGPQNWTLWLQGGGSLTLNNTNPSYYAINVWNTGGTIISTNFATLGTGGFVTLGQVVGNGPATFIYAGPATTNAILFNSGDLTPTILNNGSGAVTFNRSTFYSPYGSQSSATPQTLTLGGSGDITITGVIQDATANTFLTALVKTNVNTLTLSGNNTYSGVTTVSGGTLLVNGSIGTNSVTVVNSGSVLGGSGTIGGNVIFGSGSLATNNQGSPLTITGSLTLNNNTLKVATPSALGAGDYTLITYNPTGSSGSFNSTPVISGAGLAANTTGTIIAGGGLVKLHVVLNTQPTTLALDSSLNASTYGQTVTFTAAIQTNSVTAGNATSNVVFSVDGTPVTTNSLSSGQATYVTSLLTVPSHTISAIYVGDANYLPSTNSLTQTVNQAPLGITANNTNITYGGVPFAGGNGVTYSGFVNSETPAVLGGSLSYDGSSQGATNAGSYPITPLGQTSANYTISYTNGTLTISPASTSVGAASTNNPSGYRDAVAFTATLPALATGDVVFSTTNGPISTNSVSSGSATSLSITNLPRGTNVLTVAYLGDGNYVGSTNTLEQIVTNHPPVAVDATYYRAKGTTLKIIIADLLTNVTDGVDGDTNTLESLGTSSTGATIMTNSANIFYVPSTGANSNANDSFTYTVSDGFGGTATANVLVDVYSAAGPAQMGQPTNGLVNITFYGIPNYQAVVQTTTNLSFPWWPLTTNTFGTNGLLLFTDPNATNDQQYYRLSQP